MGLNGFFDKAKANALETANKVKDTTKHAIDTGKDKIYEISMAFLAEINGLKPILTECGFVVGDINVTLPLVEVKLTIEQTGQGKKTLEEILAEDKEKTDGENKLSNFQKVVLGSMVKANELAQITNRYGYTFKRYDIIMSSPPSVTIHLISNKVIGYDG